MNQSIKTPINFKIFTLFPEMFPGILNYSVTGRAREKGLWTLESVDIRKYALDKHGTVDDTPYGGGAGMVMLPEVLSRALEDNIDFKTESKPKLIYMSPRGKVFNQEMVNDFIKNDNINIICGRYEGIDQRVIDRYEIEEVSIGDFVLSGGELPALTVMDACIRCLPDAIGNQDSTEEESFGGIGNTEYRYLLEYPHYTKPAEWDGRKAPDVLLSGHHGKIKEWRLEQAKKITKERRPDLWEKYLESNNK